MLVVEGAMPAVRLGSSGLGWLVTQRPIRRGQWCNRPRLSGASATNRPKSRHAKNVGRASPFHF